MLDDGNIRGGLFEINKEGRNNKMFLTEENSITEVWKASIAIWL